MNRETDACFFSQHISCVNVKAREKCCDKFTDSVPSKKVYRHIISIENGKRKTDQQDNNEIR